MIVIHYFEGDCDRELTGLQHEVYGEALAIIVVECNYLARSITALPGDPNSEAWGTIESFDHRTLQTAHDLLATVWRHRLRTNQLNLPFDKAPPLSYTGSHWLGWLQWEVSCWKNKLSFVRSVQLILTNQNQPIGLLAESELSLEIMFSFPEVPWCNHLRNADEETACQRFAELEIVTAAWVAKRQAKKRQAS